MSNSYISKSPNLITYFINSAYTRGMVNLKTRKANQMASFNRMVTASIVLIVGVLIFNEIEGALPSTTGGIDSTPIVSTIGDAFGLAPIVLVVLVAALILAQVNSFN
jgi:hypothetical protein